MQTIARLSPATYALIGIRAALLEGASLATLTPIILLLIVVGVVTIPVGVFIFGWGERYAKRTGKLKRNG